MDLLTCMRSCRENLTAAKQQQAESSQFGELENTTSFGVANRRKQTDEDIAKHTDQAMFSCGSLAPKLRSGGCMDHGFSRIKEPWEASDGAVYLLRELAPVCPELVASKLPELAELASLGHFEHAPKLRATLWKCLPVIARRLGKKAFRFHFELFLDAMFNDLKCGQQLCECEAGTCIAAFRDWFGVAVFSGHLDERQRASLASDSNIPTSLVWQEDNANVGSQEATQRAALPVADAGVGAKSGQGSTTTKHKTLADRMKDMPPGSHIPNLLSR
jgi:hypothetical protein